MSTIDPTLCPICQEPNVCAMEKAKATGTKPERCWCMDAVFTPDVRKHLIKFQFVRASACSPVKQQQYWQLVQITPVLFGARLMNCILRGAQLFMIDF